MGVTSASKKRKVQDGMAGRIRPKKKFRKQTEYHSSSEDEEANDKNGAFAPVNLMDSDDDNDEHTTAKLDNKTKVPTSTVSKGTKKTQKDDDSEEDDDEPDVDASSGDENGDEIDGDGNSLADDGDEDEEDDDEDQEEGGLRLKPVTKRHDPTAFSTSISKILSTKLPSAVRADPVLSRSKDAAQVSSERANERLEQRARSKLRAEKKAEQERGRVRDVLGIERGEAGETAEEEKRLRKIAQRGVVKLFNAVRAAQVRGEEAARAEQKKGTVGIEERKKAANEVSKQSFLELINGKKGKTLNIEEA